MLVKLIVDDKRFNLNYGDVFEAKRYWIDPEKFTLIKRMSDGYEPECNVYAYQIRVLKGCELCLIYN